METPLIVGLSVVGFISYMVAVLVMGKHEGLGYAMTLPFRIMLPVMAINNTMVTGVSIGQNLAFAVGMALLLSFEHEHMPKVGVGLVILGVFL
jgi:hypothetical protein